MYVYWGTNFYGLWTYKDKQDTTCVKIRTGFVIFILDCTVIWASKLQTEISLSTMEEECNALSYCLRRFFAFKILVKEISKGTGLDEKLTTFRTTVWEDNAGVMTLANMGPGRITPI